jgi:hypothetical protein
MKILACRDVELDCDNIIKGTTEDVLKYAEENAWEFHVIKPEE